MKNKEPTLAERMSTSRKAKQAQLEKARAMAPANAPGFAERQSAKQAADVARNARIAERKAAKIREIEKRAAEEAARAAALEAERVQARQNEEALAAQRKATEEAERAEAQRRKVALEAEQKAARDL